MISKVIGDNKFYRNIKVSHKVNLHIYLLQGFSSAWVAGGDSESIYTFTNNCKCPLRCIFYLSIKVWWGNFGKATIYFCKLLFCVFFFLYSNCSLFKWRSMYLENRLNLLRYGHKEFYIYGWQTQKFHLVTLRNVFFLALLM